MDSILRPDLFIPNSQEDWDNCLQEDSKTSFITNIDYAKKVLLKHPNAAIVAVDINIPDNYIARENLAGYDIIAGGYGVSLLTNWGYDKFPFDKGYSVLIAKRMRVDLAGKNNYSRQG